MAAEVVAEVVAERVAEVVAEVVAKWRKKQQNGSQPVKFLLLLLALLPLLLTFCYPFCYKFSCPTIQPSNKDGDKTFLSKQNLGVLFSCVFSFLAIRCSYYTLFCFFNLVRLFIQRLTARTRKDLRRKHRMKHRTLHSQMHPDIHRSLNKRESFALDYLQCIIEDTACYQPTFVLSVCCDGLDYTLRLRLMWMQLGVFLVIDVCEQKYEPLVSSEPFGTVLNYST